MTRTEPSGGYRMSSQKGSKTSCVQHPFKADLITEGHDPESASAQGGLDCKQRR